MIFVKIQSILVVTFILVVAPTSTWAETTTLNVVDRGFSNEAGDPRPTSLNYQAGDPNNPAAIEHRNYFVFDMSAVTHQIASAELHLKNPLGGFTSTLDSTETYTVHEVSTDPADLISRVGGVAIFNDLGSGAIYGDYIASNADNGQTIVVHLNSAAVSSLNASFGDFAFGGAITSLNGNPTGDAEFLFGNSFGTDLTDTQLVVKGAEDALSDLSQAIIDLNISKGIENSLDGKLDSALNALDDMNENNDTAAVSSLQAFINRVEAQRGKNLTDEEADMLIEPAQMIIDSFGA